jgi:hypothetical protein
MLCNTRRQSSWMRLLGEVQPLPCYVDILIVVGRQNVYISKIESLWRRISQRGKMISPNFLARVFRVALRHQESVAPAPASLPSKEATQHYMRGPHYFIRALLESPGVHPSSCEVDGNRHNRERLPILPTDHTSLYSSMVDPQTPVPDTQAQSPSFARLPPEVRQLIHQQLFGGRRIHLDLDYVSQQAQWLWWLRVCDCPYTCPDKRFICPENAAAETMMLLWGPRL